MRKWNRDRGRRRSRKADEAGTGSEQPLQPENSESASEPEVSPAEVEPTEELQPEDTEAAATAAQPPKTRARRGRRKKKPAVQTSPVAPPEPLMPAYSQTEGPRAPLPISISPGSPTGEAAELGEPAAPVPVAPVPVTAPPAPVSSPQPARRPSKGAVVLSVGLPGSGKTTWFKRKGVTPLSSDLLRSLLFDDPTEQRHQDLVFSSLRSLLRARMIARMPANYVDATNLSPKERRHWIRMAREFGYDVHAVYFDVSLETCLERNRKRQRIVPEDVMQRMAAKLRPPTFDEGFSKIIVVKVRHRTAGPPEPGAELQAARGPEAVDAEQVAEPDTGQGIEPAE